MPSNAFTVHFEELLADAIHLKNTLSQLKPGKPGRQFRLAALNRSIVIMCVSAWESYIEELVRESLTAIRPLGPPLGVWPSLNASARSQLGRFNTPSTDQVRLLISDSLGLTDVHHSWTWPLCTPTQASQRLSDAMDLRHKIAHGVHPRPVVLNAYSRQLPDFFRRLSRSTDTAVRSYLVNVLGIANPWPLSP